MILMAVCGLLVLVGLLAVVRWGGDDLRPPATDASREDAAPGLGARRYLWYVTVAVVAGLGAGVVIAGAGGRLVMRLLAVTSGDAAQGRVTEAHEVVGRITTGGTIEFIVFTAVFLGGPTGLLYLLVRRALPEGSLGGLSYGALLFALFATRIEPLREENPDFDIVGPGWLAVVVFGALVLVHGMAVAAIAARYSHLLPLPGRNPRSLVGYLPVLTLIPVLPVALLLAVTGAVAVAASRLPPLVRWLATRSSVVARRVLLAGVALLALPGAVSGVVGIAGRGP